MTCSLEEEIFYIFNDHLIRNLMLGTHFCVFYLIEQNAWLDVY